MIMLKQATTECLFTLLVGGVHLSTQIVYYCYYLKDVAIRGLRSADDTTADKSIPLLVTRFNQQQLLWLHAGTLTIEVSNSEGRMFYFRALMWSDDYQD